MIGRGARPHNAIFVVCTRQKILTLSHIHDKMTEDIDPMCFILSEVRYESRNSKKGYTGTD